MLLGRFDMVGMRQALGGFGDTVAGESMKDLYPKPLLMILEEEVAIPKSVSVAENKPSTLNYTPH